MTIRDELAWIRDCFLPIMKASGKAKEPYIKKCVEQTVPCFALRFLLDPGMVTHVKEKSFEKKKSILPNKTYDSIRDIINDLMSVPAVNDQIIANIHNAMNQAGDAAIFGYKLLCKDITLGVTAKTVNKVLGYEFVPEFRCMLANKYFEHPDKVEGKHFYLTEKLDGIRCLAVCKENDIKLFTRQGQPIEGLLQVEFDLDCLHERINKDFVMDGELLISDRNSIPSKEQYKQTTMVVRRDGLKSGIAYNVFDVLDFEAFDRRLCDTPYYLRRQKLDAYRYFLSDFTCINILPVLYHGSDTSQIIEHLNIQRSLQHEGVMINLADEPYQFTRTNALLKVKVMQDCDLEIIGVQEGSGKFAGTLGALIVDYKGNPVGVGSGITDELRREIWAAQDKYIGRVATIQYFETTNDKDGKESIRFPVFKELREEGKEVSYA